MSSEVFVYADDVHALMARADHATAQLSALAAKFPLAERGLALESCVADCIVANSSPGADRHEAVMCFIADLTMKLRDLDPDACPEEVLELVGAFDAGQDARP